MVKANNQLETASMRDLADAARAVQAEEITLSAWKGRRIKSKIFQSPVTQEKIDEYNAQFNEPVEREGDSTKYLYRPASMMKPDLEDFIAPEIVPTEEQIGKKREHMKIIAERINVIDSGVEQDILNKKILKYREELTDPVTSKNRKGNLKDKIRDCRKELNKLAHDKISLVGILEAEQQSIRNIEANININGAEQARIANINRERLKEYEENLIEQNRGRLNIQRQPTESDEDYLARMSDVADTRYDQERADFEADMTQLKLLKTNLKDIIRKESMIEAVVKAFSHSDRFQLNKYFAFIKDRFTKHFGADNQNLTATEVIDLLKEFLQIGKYGSNYELAQLEDDEEEDETDVNPKNFDIFDEELKNRGAGQSEKFSVKNNGISLEIINKQKNHKLYIKCVTQKIKQDVERNMILFSHTGEEGSFAQLKYGPARYEDDGVDTLLNKYLDMTVDEQRTILGGVEIGDIAEHLNSKGISPRKAKRIKKNVNIGSNLYTEKSIWGWGVKTANIPKTCPFGKVSVNLQNLFYKNVLTVKHQNGINIPSFRNVKVSDNMVKLVMKQCQGETIKRGDYDNLSSLEREIYDKLIYVAGLHKTTEHHSVDKSKESYKNRLEVIVGEIEAGNNNPELMQQLYDTLHTLVSFNVLANSEAKRYYNEYKNQYFS